MREGAKGHEVTPVMYCAPAPHTVSSMPPCKIDVVPCFGGASWLGSSTAEPEASKPLPYGFESCPGLPPAWGADTGACNIALKELSLQVPHGAGLRGGFLFFVRAGGEHVDESDGETETVR